MVGSYLGRIHSHRSYQHSFMGFNVWISKNSFVGLYADQLSSHPHPFHNFSHLLHHALMSFCCLRFHYLQVYPYSL